MASPAIHLMPFHSETEDKILRALSLEFQTIAQIKQKTGLCRATVEYHIHYMLGANRLETKKYGNATAYKLKNAGRKS
jgi:predicted transcriptional regulator